MHALGCALASSSQPCSADIPGAVLWHAHLSCAHLVTSVLIIAAPHVLLPMFCSLCPVPCAPWPAPCALCPVPCPPQLVVPCSFIMKFMMKFTRDIQTCRDKRVKMLGEVQGSRC